MEEISTGQCRHIPFESIQRNTQYSYILTSIPGYTLQLIISGNVLIGVKKAAVKYHYTKQGNIWYS